MLWTCNAYVAHDCQDKCTMQVAGELEVKAQIKLRINTATQQPVVIIRSFQVLLCTHVSCAVASAL